MIQGRTRVQRQIDEYVRRVDGWLSAGAEMDRRRRQGVINEDTPGGK